MTGPKFYLDHREDFIKWLGNTAKHITINSYESFLKMYVFPFFFEKLELKHPRQWDEDSLSMWGAMLSNHIKSPNSRNRVRTGMRRYLKFLKSKNIIKRVPQILNEVKRRDTREKMLPGELPHWKDVVEWIKKLPKGKYRFLRAVMLGFGLRISEAFELNEEDFFGAEEENNIDQRNDFVREVKDKGFGKLFVYVNKAKKRNVNSDLIKFLGSPCMEPKSGPYTACCTNLDLAELIVSMLENKEHLEDLTFDSIYKLKSQMPTDQSKFKFHLYNPHDDRRLNITLQMMDLTLDNAVELCCIFHGQSSRDVFMRYFQWGRLQRRNQKRKVGQKLRVFK